MLTQNGVSTIKSNEFKYEKYYSVIITRKPYIQWDYRDENGKLHSGIATSIEAAKIAAERYGYINENS